MADKIIKLTKDDKERVEAWLTEKCGAIPPCPLCRQKSWIVGEQIVGIRSVQEQQLWGGSSSTYPHVIMTCVTCANSVFLNAVLLGFVEETGTK